MSDLVERLMYATLHMGRSADIEAVKEALALLASQSAELSRLSALVAWQDIETAPKDGTRILVLLKNPLPSDRDDLRMWDGIPFVARHPGLADDGFDFGWNFAAPVGHGGFPDEWFQGWMNIPRPPVSQLKDTTNADRN